MSELPGDRISLAPAVPGFLPRSLFGPITGPGAFFGPIRVLGNGLGRVKVARPPSSVSVGLRA